MNFGLCRPCAIGTGERRNKTCQLLINLVSFCVLKLDNASNPTRTTLLKGECSHPYASPAQSERHSCTHVYTISTSFPGLFTEGNPGALSAVKSPGNEVDAISYTYCSCYCYFSIKFCPTAVIPITPHRAM